MRFTNSIQQMWRSRRQEAYLKQAKLGAGGVSPSAAQDIHLAQAEVRIPTALCTVWYISRAPTVQAMVHYPHKLLPARTAEQVDMKVAMYSRHDIYKLTA